MKDYEQRMVLHNEVHARPPESIQGPMAISHLVVLYENANKNDARAHLHRLLARYQLPIPGPQTNHLSMNFGLFKLRWELHTEFACWTFMRAGNEKMLAAQAAPQTAIESVPQDWLEDIPGECLCKIHLWLLPANERSPAMVVADLLHENSLVGATVAEGHGEVYTDFQIHADGFSRILLLAGAITVRRQGRLVQQLLEIETYRMAALLGLPVAHASSAVLANAEKELSELALAVQSVHVQDEAILLDRLTRLAGMVEGQYASTHSRFSASKAYFELVDRRIQDIRETRIHGLQTIGDFMERRLSPARSTCEWASRRQVALSERVSRVSDLLRTRVSFEQQQSSQAFLSAMNKRQGLQLQLQATVEGLSVAAITYYIMGLLDHLARAAEKMGLISSPKMATAIGLPIVILLVWLAIQRIHKKVFQD